jgi:hypothetical protein
MHTPTITTWLNTAASWDFYGYRNSMVTVQGKLNAADKRLKVLKFSILNSRLHHDQTAHALESAAAAYSNYPMTGEFQIS